jgi:hypothetical protein
MKIRRFSLAVLLAFVLVPSLGLAAPDPLSYDDPGMHFRPPDGWVRVSLEEAGGDPSGGKPPAAVYILRKGPNDIRTIIIMIDSFNGQVDELEHSHENELRKTNENTFIDKHEKTALANGMPAYWLRASEGKDLGAYKRRYEWVVADGARSIIVTYIGRQGVFDDKEAKDALASLYVVAFPRGRRSN